MSKPVFCNSRLVQTELLCTNVFLIIAAYYHIKPASRSIFKYRAQRRSVALSLDSDRGQPRLNPFVASIVHGRLCSRRDSSGRSHNWRNYQRLQFVPRPSSIQGCGSPASPVGWCWSCVTVVAQIVGVEERICVGMVDQQKNLECSHGPLLLGMRSVGSSLKAVGGAEDKFSCNYSA
jgi:hypothetical protein